MGESLASPQPAVSAVSVLVAFPGTSQLSTNLVNSGKYFAVGMVAQSQDNKLGQDYANFAMVYLTSSGSSVIVGEVWTLPDGQCSTFLGIPYSCPNPTLDFAASWACDCYTTSSYVDMVTLTMQWSSGNLNWLATVEGVQYSLFTYTPGSSQQTSFHVGQHSDPACTILGFTLCVEEYFQFGAMFNATPKSGWEAYVGSPRYFSVSDNTWKAVQQGITGAQNPLFDAIYGVGGGGISGTNALDGCSNSGKFPGIFVPTSLVFGQLIIYPSSFSGHKLWDTNCPIDSYAPAATFVDSSAGGNTPPAGSWQNGNFQVTFNFYDTGPVQAAAYLPLCVDYVESWNGVSWVVTHPVSTLNCFPGPICCPSFTVITSPSGDCQFQGVNACRVNLWAEDFVGNISPVTSRSFSIDTVPPSAPSPLSPQNGASVSPTPTLTWSAATDATSGVAGYNLQLSTSFSFTSPTTYYGLTTTSYAIASSLSSTTWYWRVEAVDNAGNIGPWSSTSYFNVQDFSISASPTSVTVYAGSAGTSTIAVTALNGFSGIVNLASSVSPSTGLACSLTTTSVTGSGTSMLSCSGSAGTYTVTVTGNSGTLSHSATVSYIVQDFSISTSPSSSSLTLAGSSATSTVTVASLGGFSAAVSLTFSTSPSGPVVSLWPASLTPSSGGSATSTFYISAGGATPGTYTISVTGTSGSLVHTVTVTVTVTGDFSIAASPVALTIPAGSSGTSTLTLTSLSGFSGTITLASSASVSISAVSIDDGYCRSFGLLIDQQLNYPDFWNSQPNSVIGIGCGSFTYSNSYSLASGSHFLEFGVSAWVGHWHVQITVNGILMANADTAIFSHVHVPFQVGGSSVAPIVTNGPTGSLSATSTTLSAGGSSAITLTITTTSATPPQNYVFTLTATSGGVSHATTVTVHVVDFSITTSPSIRSLTLAGSSTTSTVTVASLNGFSGTVPLTVSTSPAGPVVSLWPNSLAISSGGSATSTLSISAGAATPGTYTVTVTGTSGGLSHSATVTITVSGDFGISASPTSLSMKVGKSASSTLTLTSLNGFAGTISLTNQATIKISATTTDDPYCRSFGLLIDQQLNYPDFWNSQPGSVIGTGCGSFSYSNTYVLTTGSHFLEFGVSAYVGHWHVQITVNGVAMANVDSDLSHHVHVAFSVGGVSITPVVTSGPTASFTSPTVTISAGGSGTTTLTVSTSKSTLTGTYTVTVTATSGGLSHSVTVTVAVG